MLAVMLADLVDGDDIRVLQVGRGFGLAQKACDLVRTGQGAGADHFEGHVPIQVRLPGLPDHAHAAAGDFFEKLVVAEILQMRPGIGGDRGCRRRVKNACRRHFWDRFTGRFAGKGGLEQTFRAKALRGIAGQWLIALRTEACGGHGSCLS